MGGNLPEGIRVPRALLSHFAEVAQCCVSQLKPRIALGLVLVALFHTEPADEERQRQSLKDQRREDQTEGQEDDQVALEQGAFG